MWLIHNWYRINPEMRPLYGIQDISNLKQWHNQLARNLVLASGRTDGQEVEWLNMVLADGAKFDLFESSGEARFATLDIKLHSALMVCITEGNKALAAKLSKMGDEYMMKGKIIKGR